MSIPSLAALLVNIAANATGSAAYLLGGVYSFETLGTLGGGTVTLQTLAGDGATWEAVGSSTTVTSVGLVNGLYLPSGSYRAVLSGASGAAGVYATLRGSLS